MTPEIWIETTAHTHTCFVCEIVGVLHFSTHLGANTKETAKESTRPRRNRRAETLHLRRAAKKDTRAGGGRLVREHASRPEWAMQSWEPNAEVIPGVAAAVDRG